MAKTEKKKASAPVAKATVSPKQLAVKAISLMKGIDNTVAVIAKKQIDLAAKQSLLNQTLSAGLSSLVNAPKTPAAKPVKVAKVKPVKVKAAKPVKVAKAKAEKPAKVAKPVKVKAAKSAVKVAKSKKDKPAKAPKADAKPAIHVMPLKDIVDKILTGQSLGPSVIHTKTAEFGKWSRQSVYNVLKKDARFVKDGENYRRKADGESVQAAPEKVEPKAPKVVKAPKPLKPNGKKVEASSGNGVSEDDVEAMIEKVGQSEDVATVA